ncbi:hypothetical protein V1524DRAFT_438633 [Lipomyces starkeyi]
MKLGIAATVVLALLVARTQADVWYWCTGNGECNFNEQGVGPTYTCGEFLFDYYDSGWKQWLDYDPGLTEDLWASFYDCCHASDKGACYDIM